MGLSLILVGLALGLGPAAELIVARAEERKAERLLRAVDATVVIDKKSFVQPVVEIVFKGTEKSADEQYEVLRAPKRMSFFSLVWHARSW